MMKQILKRTGALLLSLCLTLSVWGVLTPLPAAAETSGDYEYSVNSDGTATITKYLGSGGDVTIPRTLDGHTVTAIGRAFYDCDELTSVIIPGSITTIGQYAFSFCTELTSVTIENGVTAIGGDAFYYCYKLTSVTIPDSVTEIVWSAFVNTGYYNNPANWENGVLYIDHHLIDAKEDKLPAVYSVRPGTKTIADYAFQGYTKLTSITIPNSVITVGAGAFDGCTGLTSVTIGNGVTTIDHNAFSGCTGLTSVIIPDSVTSIGYDAFTGCTKLTSIHIPDSVAIMGVAFSDTGYYNDPANWKNGVLYIDNHLIEAKADELPAVYSIRPGTKTIGYRAFKDCTGLTSVDIPDSVIEIGDEAFNSCTKLTSVNIPDGVTEIGYKTFYYCAGLTSVTIPDKVSSIGDAAFYYCTGLTSVTLGDGLTYIGEHAFTGCTGLTSVTIPGSVTEIDMFAFAGCTGLISVTIPNSVTTIGESAFSNCTELTSITIPDSVTEISYHAFLSSTGLTSIIVGANNPNYSSKDGVLFNKDQTKLILCPQGKSGSYTIPSSVTEIGYQAFWWCTGLTSVIIPDSVTTIGAGAFEDCTGLTSVTIPDSVTEIGASAFRDCTRLTSVTIPDSVTEIDDYAFSGCYNLTIYGKVGSYAETYAKENRIPFGTKATNQETGIVVEGTAETLPDNAVLNAKQTASDEDAATYEITLTQNGQPIQPTGEVTVKIPLPESMKDKRITVYRVEADGSRTNMNATVQNGCAVFITDHFSQYVLEASDALLGDIDGDGKVSVTDALAILRMAVGLSAPVDNADMDGSGSVTVTDALAALRIAVGLA